MKSKKQIFMYILVIIVILIIIYLVMYNKYDNFDSPQTTKKSFERTQLYGSLFLDNLNTVITNMTDPPIMYDTKTIDLIKYSDVI